MGFGPLFLICELGSKYHLIPQNPPSFEERGVSKQRRGSTSPLFFGVVGGAFLWYCLFGFVRRKFIEKEVNQMVDKSINEEELPCCPECGTNEFVGKIDEGTHVMLVLFVFSPGKPYFCSECGVSFE